MDIQRKKNGLEGHSKLWLLLVGTTGLSETSAGAESMPMGLCQRVLRLPRTLRFF